MKLAEEVVADRLEKVASHLRSHPGATIEEMREATGLSPHRVRYALRLLERKDLLVTERKVSKYGQLPHRYYLEHQEAS